MDQGLGWVVRLDSCLVQYASTIWLFQIICSDLFFHKSAFIHHFLLAVGGGSGLAEARDTGEDLFTVVPDLFH